MGLAPLGPPGNVYSRVKVCAWPGWTAALASTKTTAKASAADRGVATNRHRCNRGFLILDPESTPQGQRVKETFVHDCRQVGFERIPPRLCTCQSQGRGFC